MHHRPIALSLFVLGCYAPLGDPPADPAREAVVLTPEGEETHQCGEDAMLPFRPPPALLDPDSATCDAVTEPYCFTLHPDLRAVAGDPQAAMDAAVTAYERFLEDADPVDRQWGDAFADLAVSGAASYAAFEADPPSLEGDPAAVRRATRRAHRVAWALRGPASHRALARPALGWIAVSPEDDPPGRPTNVAAGPFFQEELVVPTALGDGDTLDVRTRVLVASTLGIEEPEVDLDALPPRRAIALPPEGDVVLSLHGHSSLAEETAPLAAALVAAYREAGEDVTLIAMDLPSNGYAERVHPDDVLRASDEPDAVLRFFEAFVEGVVRELGIADRLDAVIGGSLGGNLVLRLAERRLPWVRRAVAWSPASIDYSWTRSELADLIKSEAVRMTRHESEEAERAGTRQEFFVGGLTSIRNQAGYWYRDDWRPCQARFVEEGLLQIGETYDDRLRRWHYRVAYEQLVLSHLEPAPGEDEPRFRAIRAPLLLLTGEADNAVPMQTYFFVERLAPYLESPGRTLFLRNTGHAMHSERPRLVAQEIATFLLEG